MITIEKEKTITEKYTVYQAVDGTEFNSKEECKQYEESVRGVLRGRLKELIVNDKYNGWELMGGNEDNKILAIKIKTLEDKEIVLQNYYLDNPWVLREDNNALKGKLLIYVDQAYHQQDIILFGLNCDDYLYFINTRGNIVNSLNNLEFEE